MITDSKWFQLINHLHFPSLKASMEPFNSLIADDQISITNHLLCTNGNIYYLFKLQRWFWWTGFNQLLDMFILPSSETSRELRRAGSPPRWRRPELAPSDAERAFVLPSFLSGKVVFKRGTVNHLGRVVSWNGKSEPKRIKLSFFKKANSMGPLMFVGAAARMVSPPEVVRTVADTPDKWRWWCVLSGVKWFTCC